LIFLFFASFSGGGATQNDYWSFFNFNSLPINGLTLIATFTEQAPLSFKSGKNPSRKGGLGSGKKSDGL